KNELAKATEISLLPLVSTRHIFRAASMAARIDHHGRNQTMKTSKPTNPWTRCVGIAATVLSCLMLAVADAQAQTQKPNILMIMGDDIGWFNPSCYNSGVMGYQTPNIDRIAREGARFTDWYGQQSCTAGRAAFITGQSPIRTG